MIARRLFLALGSCAALASLFPGAAIAQDNTPPVVFVHGNGDSAAIWMTTIWRFASNGWPANRLVAVEMPYPSARDDDAVAQPGRSSTAEQMAYLKAEVEKVLKSTGASQVVLFALSRGGNTVRNYIQNGGGDKTVSHAILGGTPNHGIWAIKGFREGNEFSGTGPFLSALNAPKNAAGDEVTGPVKWMTVRSDNNDKYAQPDGVWVGMKGTATNVRFDGPSLKGAANMVAAGIDHRETAVSPEAFVAAYQFITGKAPSTPQIMIEPRIILSGNITGMGVDSLDPKSGNDVNNLPIPGAELNIYEVNEVSGRRGENVYTRKVGADGRWGPFTTKGGAPYEFEITAPGYATTHIYRSHFPRSSDVVNLRPERIVEADKDAKSITIMTRPRGYFDARRDRMSFDGQTPPPGVPPEGAGVSSSKIKAAQYDSRTVKAEFNGEKLIGRTRNAGENRVVVLELTN